MFFRGGVFGDSSPVRDPSPVPKHRSLRARRLIVGEVAIRRVLEQVRHVAATDSTVLLLGEPARARR